MEELLLASLYDRTKLQKCSQTMTYTNHIAVAL